MNGSTAQPGTTVRNAAAAASAWGVRTLRTAVGARLCLLGLAAASATVLALGFIHPAASYDPTLRAAVETVIVLCALGGTWLLRGQFARSRRVRDVLLFGGLLVLALLHLFSYALPAVLNLHAGNSFAAALLCGNVVVAAAFAAAALVSPDRVLSGGGDPRSIILGAGVLAVGVAELGGLLLRQRLVPEAEHPVEGLGSALQHPFGVVLIAVAGGLFVIAAVAFGRRGAEQPSILTLAAASILLAVAGLYALALPALPPNWIAPGLGLRLCAWLLVLSAVVGRELNHRADDHAQSRLTAVIAERRRVAGNLHDGLAQDLAFITANATLLAEHLGAEHPLTVAARRALGVSRAAITELSDSSASNVHEALEGVADELGQRFEIGVALDAQIDAELAPEMREHVVRIAREAIANAARHGQAEHVSVTLKRKGNGVVLRVRDDGCGFAHAKPAAAGGGFGLRGMRERAAARRGHLIVSEPEEGGTELEVLLR